MQAQQKPPLSWPGAGAHKDWLSAAADAATVLVMQQTSTPCIKAAKELEKGLVSINAFNIIYQTQNQQVQSEIPVAHRVSFLYGQRLS